MGRAIIDNYKQGDIYISISDNMFNTYNCAIITVLSNAYKEQDEYSKHYVKYIDVERFNIMHTTSGMDYHDNKRIERLDSRTIASYKDHFVKIGKTIKEQEKLIKSIFTEVI